jgi:hypothetical protein
MDAEIYCCLITYSGAGFTSTAVFEQKIATKQHAWSGREPQDDDSVSRRKYLTSTIIFTGVL